MAAFLGGYALVWTSFGWLAFVGDTMVHATVDRTPWLQQHEWLIAGARWRWPARSSSAR
jgi:predicted metal-binding membrane protein